MSPQNWASRLGVVATAVSLALAGCSYKGQSKHVPADTDSVLKSVPPYEPPSKLGNPPSYEVFGKRYYVMSSADGYMERGIASWYGPQFHGRRTSNGEQYDMYGMSAAHKTLPLPSWVEVTNLLNGRQITVRVNDRGPFYEGRIIDLSYTAAQKLGMDRSGTAPVRVRALTAGSFPAEPLQVASIAPVPFEPVEKLAPGAVTTSAAKLPFPLAKPIEHTPPKPAESAPTVADLPPAPSPTSRFFLQVGSFSNPDNAERLRGRLAQTQGSPVVVDQAANGGRSVYRVRIGPLANRDQADNLAIQLDILGVQATQLVAMD